MKLEGLPNIARVASGRQSLAIDIDERHIHVEGLTRSPELPVNDEPAPSVRAARTGSGADRAASRDS